MEDKKSDPQKEEWARLRSIGWVKVIWGNGKVIKVDLKERGKGESNNILKREIEKVLRRGRISNRIHLDMGTLSQFAQIVLNKCREIKPGEVMSYGELARSIGRPKASRAVGQVLAHNPFPILVPCHRVVMSDGGLGGFSAGLRIKRRLLELEGWRVYKEKNRWKIE